MTTVRRAVLGSEAFARIRALYDDTHEPCKLYMRIVYHFECAITMEVAQRLEDNYGRRCYGFAYDSVFFSRSKPLPPAQLHELNAMEWCLEDEDEVPVEESQPVREVMHILSAELRTRLPFKVRAVRPTTEGLRALFLEPRYCETPFDVATEIYYAFNNLIVHHELGIAIFDSSQNVWLAQNKNDQLSHVVLARLIMAHGHALKTKKNATITVDPKRCDAVLAALRTVVPIQQNWVDTSLRNARGYLCFRNGYFDFAEQAFIPGLYPSRHFLVCVRDDYEPASAMEIEEARDFLKAPYGDDEVFDFYTKAVARALAGDVTVKAAYFILGSANTGKSCVTGALIHAFPSVVETFDPSNLCSVFGDQDRARQMAWLSNLVFCRLGIGNEVDLVGQKQQARRFNHILFKTVVSGGDDQIDIRFLYKEISRLHVGFTLLVHANDIPRFTSVDSAVKARSRVLYQTRVSSEKPVGPDEFLRDPNAQKRVRDDDFKRGLRDFLLRNAYTAYVATGHNVPAQVTAATDERVNEEEDVEEMEELFYIWPPEEAAKFRGALPKTVADSGWMLTNAVFNSTVKGLPRSAAECKKAMLKRHPHVTYKRAGIGFVFYGLRAKK